MEECYPYSIDSVPLSYGTSQLTRVSANFYYAKHSVVFQDQGIGSQGPSGWGTQQNEGEVTMKINGQLVETQGEI